MARMYDVSTITSEDAAMPPAEKPPTPTDAQMRARALSRWEGEGGGLGRSGPPGDVLDDAELRILARIGAAALAVWHEIPPERRESLLRAVCKPLEPGDGARAKAHVAAFLRENGDR
jgi:hypothetical protein